MTSVTVSEVIERPPAEVFRFVATDHVRNHPRWDPNMTLEPTSAGPMGVGPMIRRSYMQGDRRIEGEMEVTEYEPDRAMSVVIHDGPVELRSRVTFAPAGEQGTLLTIQLEADVPAERMDEGAVRRSVDRMKELIEAER